MKVTLQAIEASPRTKQDDIGLNKEIISMIMPIADPIGLFMEFGIWFGRSIRKIAIAMERQMILQKVYGFDSFKGLPEAWATMPAGSFYLDGSPPDIQDKRIIIVAGWFHETLPDFLLEHSNPASFIHIDCDVYTSTKYVLTMLTDRIVSGTVLLFDEMINVVDYELHEFKAFNEFLEENNKEVEILCHSRFQVAFKIV